MVDQVVPVLCFVGLADIDTILLGHLLHLLRATGEKDIVGMKVVPVLSQRLERIASWVDAHKDWLHLFRQLWVVFLESVHDLTDLDHLGRTNIRTPSEPKV